MVDSEVIEGYLIRSGVEYENVEDGMWIVHDEDETVDNVVITHSPPLVLFRVKLMDLPKAADTQSALFRKLLELNATEMISGAYGLENSAVVASEALQDENLDYNEFQAALDGLTLAITEHYEDLKQYFVPTGDGEAQQAAAQ